jgi:hypothetical protein
VAFQKLTRVRNCKHKVWYIHAADPESKSSRNPQRTFRSKLSAILINKETQVLDFESPFHLSIYAALCAGQLYFSNRNYTYNEGSQTFLSSL